MRKKKIYLDFNLSVPLEIHVIMLLFGTNFNQKLCIYREAYLRASWKSFSQSSEKHKHLMSTLSTCLNLQHIQKALGHQIRNKTYRYHSRCWKFSLLLCTHSLYLHKMFAFMCWSYFSETGNKTQNFKFQSSCVRHPQYFQGECSSLALMSSNFC